jgi:hypothetical protein
MEVSEVRKLKAIHEENMRLKKLVADQALKIQLLEEVSPSVPPLFRRRT